MSRRILIADDHVPTRRDLQAFLQQQGFEVLAVGNGDLAARRAGEMHPDLVILDVLMPGKTGYEACRHIKQVLKLELPVLMIHHDVEPFDRNEAARVGADETLVKPLDPFALLETIHALWRKYGRPLMGTEPAELVEEVQEEDVEAVFGGGVVAPPPDNAPSSDQEAATTADDTPLAPLPEPSQSAQAAADTPEAAHSLDSASVSSATEQPAAVPSAPSETGTEPPVPLPEVSPTAVDAPATTLRTPTMELPDPYSVVASGDYATYFSEEASNNYTEHTVPEAGQDTAQDAIAHPPAPDISAVDTSASTPPAEAETIIKQDIPFTDPYPSRNIFAPIPTQTTSDISFTVPERITSELPPPDPSAGLSIHFDSRNAAVHIGGLYEVTEVELPEHPTQELTPVPTTVASPSETLDEADVSGDLLPLEALPAEEVARLQETGTDILASAVIVAVTPPPTENASEVQTVVCPHCGGQALESDIICPHCGEML
jgi:DNA-binding response OmpR family regulator